MSSLSRDRQRRQLVECAGALAAGGNGIFIQKSAEVEAVLAGNNILIVTDYKNAYNEILNAYKNKQISDTLIDYLVSKNIAWKYYKELNWR